MTIYEIELLWQEFCRYIALDINDDIDNVENYNSKLDKFFSDKCINKIIE